MLTTTEAGIRPLRRLNVIAGLLHAASLTAVLALANGFSLPVTTTYYLDGPGKGFTAPVLLFNIRVAYAIAAFFALSAVFHFIVASPKFFSRYAASLMAGRNIFRWVEYSLSSSIMIILIAQLNGISEIAALIAIFGVNVSMILFGWLQEKNTTPGDGDLLPFAFGCIAGVVPWLIFALKIVAPNGPPGYSVPGFVYGIVASLFVLFNCFALVQWKQYRAKGKWANYLLGERTYIVLSLVAKSVLAWQIFASTLAA
ncbi:MAG: heliorhodopsin HeR [Ilumatobacteraceae bacterium]